ncbi:MAG: GTPase [Fimbriiglobus sp.]
MMHYSLLTPAGTSAIAVLQLSGKACWEYLRSEFRPAGKPLPEDPVVGLTRFGQLGEGAGDEVVLVVHSAERVEIHCHGGPAVVQMLSSHFDAAGAKPASWKDADSLTAPGKDQRALAFLAHAPTLRNAAHLLAQYHGAYNRAVSSLKLPEDVNKLDRLHALADFGLHLVTPWKVVIVGRPNAGKSSLMNALAGFQRSVVTPIAGTTRDLVTLDLAFSGTAIEFTDTAGLRETIDPLEAEGVRRAQAAMKQADLVVRVVDATDPEVLEASAKELVVWNKTDLAPAPAAALSLSTKTGTGLAELIAEIRQALEPIQPASDEAIPYAAELIEAVSLAHQQCERGEFELAQALLKSTMVIPLKSSSVS